VPSLLGEAKLGNGIRASRWSRNECIILLELFQFILKKKMQMVGTIFGEGNQYIIKGVDCQVRETAARTAAKNWLSWH
jgi:hypothetical protein